MSQKARGESCRVTPDTTVGETLVRAIPSMIEFAVLVEQAGEPLRDILRGEGVREIRRVEDLRFTGRIDEDGRKHAPTLWLTRDDSPPDTKTGEMGYRVEGRCTCGAYHAPCAHLVAFAGTLLRKLCEESGLPIPSGKTGLDAFFDGAPVSRLRMRPPKLTWFVFAKKIKNAAACTQQEGGRKAAPEPPPEPGRRWWEVVCRSKSPEELRTNMRKAIASIIVVDALQLEPWDFDKIAAASQTHPPAQFLKEVHASVLRRVKRQLDGKALEQLQHWMETEEALEIDRRYRKDTLLPSLKKQFDEAIGIPLDQQEPNSFIEVEWFLHQPRTGLPILEYQVLHTSERMERLPRTLYAISRLVSLGNAGKSVFPHHHFAFLEWLLDHEARYAAHGLHAGGVTASKAETRPVSEVMIWLQDLSGRSPVRWRKGGEPVPGERQARVVLRVEEDRAVFGIEVPLDGGAEFMTQGNFTPECTPFVLRESRREQRYFFRHGNTVHRVHPSGFPSELIAEALEIESFPLDFFRKGSLAPQLARRIREAGGSAEGLVGEVPVRPVVIFRLGRGRLVEMSLRAHAADGREFLFDPWRGWFLTAGGARPLDPEEIEITRDEGEASGEGPEAGNLPQAIEYQPRRSDVGPVMEWLETFLPGRGTNSATGPGDNTRMWELKAREFAALPEKWLDRPPGVTYYGSPSFRDLVSLQHPPRMDFHFEKGSGVDWLSLSVELEEEAKALPLNVVTTALRQTDSAIVRLRDGSTYRRDELEEYRRRLEYLGSIGVDPGRGGKHDLHAMVLAAGLESADPAGDESLMRLGEASRQTARSFKGIPGIKLPPETAQWLRPYQRKGAEFLHWACGTFGGAVLADEMGLGKTIQVLATLGALRRKAGRESRAALIICPSSVLHNWRREAEKFAPSLSLAVLEAGQDRFRLHERLEEHDLVIVNFALTRIDFAALEKVEWMAVCIDEAQHIKNRGAAISKLVKKLRARHRIALTGTPVENRLEDLHSIAEFAVPGYLGGMRRAFESSAAEDLSARLSMIRTRLRPVLLRRLKKEVAPDLPERIEERRDCDMLTPQKKIYLAEVRKARELLQASKATPGGKGHLEILTALTRLRQICCHPELAGHEKAGSGKLEEMIPHVLEILEDGHKVLVFSQFVTMIKLIENRFRKEKIPFLTLTGQTKNRQQLVDEFEGRGEPCVFLISLKAGGSGLNLTSASHVILFDPWWNPAVEAQAIDRTHRIGQDKAVVALRLVTRGTVEERIMELQEKKRELISNVFEEEAFNRTLTREDLVSLLSGGDDEG